MGENCAKIKEFETGEGARIPAPAPGSAVAGVREWVVADLKETLGFLEVPPPHSHRSNIFHSAVAVSPATHAPPPLPMHVPHHACTPNPSSLSWTEFLTHACENITFPQLLLQQIGAPLPLDPPLLSVFDIDLVLVCFNYV